ncbi:MAG: lysozyme inhibitor LprI family protein [Hyphomicrobiales bacterium]
MNGSVHAAALFAIAQIAATAVLAQGPDCKDPQTQTDMNMCAGLAYKAADGELNAAYKKTLAAMREQDAALPAELKGAEVTLREAQRAWIVFRDKCCELEGFEARGGSMEPMLVGHCLAKVTNARTKELKELAGGGAN